MTTILIEIPDELGEALQQYLSDRPDWNCDRAATAALSLLMLQNIKTCDRAVSKIYLNSIFNRTIALPDHG